MRLLVTGKNGQLGSSIYKIANTATGDSLSRHEFIFVGREELDLSLESSITHYFDYNGRFDVIINCAAYTAVDKAEEEQALADQVNHLAVKQLAQIAKSQDSKLIHISTDYVFDGESGKPYIETDETNPINVYGKSKLAGEKALRAIMSTKAMIIRTSWVYSEHGNNFVKTMLRLSETQDALNVVSDQIGGPTPARDIAAACLQIANQLIQDKTKSGTYHFSGALDVSWAEFAKEIFAQADRNVKVIPIPTAEYPTPAKRPLNSRLKCHSTEHVFGIKRPNWRDGLKEILKDLEGRS